MSFETYKKVRALIALFIGLTVSSSVILNNITLAIAAVITGVVSLFVAQRKVKGAIVDERIQIVGDKAARMAFTVLTLVLGFSSLLLVFVSRRSAPYLEGLGYIFSYITLFSLLVYSLAFYYFNRKYGATDEE